MENDKSAEIKAIFADMSIQGIPALIEGSLNVDYTMQIGFDR